MTIESTKLSLIMPARPGMSRSSDEISPNDLSVAICTAREPGTLKRGRKTGLKARQTKKSQAAFYKVAYWMETQRAKTSGDKKKSAWKALKSAVRPSWPRAATNRGWKVLKKAVLKKKKRAAKKKMGAVVKFKRGGKAAKRRRARARLAQILDSENAEALAREILSAKAHLAKLQTAANPSNATPGAPPVRAPLRLECDLLQYQSGSEAGPTMSKLSYDEAWVEFRSVIYVMLRTTDPDTISDTILDTLDIQDVTNRMWKRTRNLLVKMLGGKSAYYHRVMLRPEAVGSSEWRELLSSLEQGKVCPFEDLTFGSLLNLEQLRVTDNEAFSGYAPRWEQAVWKLAKSICESWDYDPGLKVLSV